MNKRTGTYYTPRALADFVVNHALKTIKVDSIDFLEPSVGDGVFLEAISCNDLINSYDKITATIVDINKTDLIKAKEKILKQKCKIRLSVKNEDFLEFQRNKRTKYSLIIGNPPYIKGNFLSSQQINLCKEIHEKAKLPKRKVNNIWTSFVVASNKMLKDNGTLAFVLPSDILQVNYANEIRCLLEKSFERIELFTLDLATFPDIEQKTIILFAYKKSSEKGVFFYKLSDIQKASYYLLSSNNAKVAKNKWTHYLLSQDEVEFLNKLKEKLPKISDFCESATGIVTGANDYFILPKKNIPTYNLNDHVLPIIQKGSFVNGSVDFSVKDFNELVKQEKPTFLVNLDDKQKITKKLNKYLALGIVNGIDKRYKCSLRRKWYSIPYISNPPEGFFFKRSHLYPKLIRNNANVYTTDAAYRIKMKDDFKIEDLIFSFYNYVSLVFAELFGRRYGGGVLELTPNEFKELPIIYSSINQVGYNSFKRKFEKKINIEEFLSGTQDGVTTYFDNADLCTLKKIYQKLKGDRLL